MEDEYFHGKGLDIANNQSRLSLSWGTEKDLGVFRLFLVNVVLFLVGAGNVSADSGLVAEYHFDGNAQDSSGNGIDKKGVINYDKN